MTPSSNCYTQGCEHPACREEHRARARQGRADAQARGLAPDDPRHGTPGGYDWWGCRCAPCGLARKRRRGREARASQRKSREPRSGERGPSWVAVDAVACPRCGRALLAQVGARVGLWLPRHVAGAGQRCPGSSAVVDATMARVTRWRRAWVPGTEIVIDDDDESP